MTISAQERELAKKKKNRAPILGVFFHDVRCRVFGTFAVASMIHATPRFITCPTAPDHHPSLPVKPQDEIVVLKDPQDEQLQSDDNYDGMEQMFSASFPLRQLPVSSITNEVGSLDPSKRTPGERSRTSIGQDDSNVRAGDYSVDIESGEALSDTLSYQVEIDDQDQLDSVRSEISNTSEAHYSSTEDPAQKTTAEHEELLIAQSKLFKRRRRNRMSDELNGDDRCLACCGRCKSDLNRKLLVRCASCSFCRHLYCFTPPLKQHPAFQYQQTTARKRKAANLPPAEVLAKWRCDSCRERLGKSHPRDTSDWVYRPSKMPTTTNFGGIKETGTDRQLKEHRMVKIDCINSSTPQVDRADAEHQNNPKKPSPSDQQQITHVEDASSDDDRLYPVQTQWDDGFDWFAFRAQKVEKVLVARSQSAAATRGGNELVYYSQSFSDMKKITACWMASVEKHKRFERQRELNITNKRLPSKRCVMYSLTERERAQIEATLRRRRRDAEEEESLFDDSRTYQFDISLSRIQYLRQPRPTITIFPYGEALEIATLLLAEMAECIEIAAENVNVCSLQIEDAAEETASDVLEQQTLHLAAKTIQTVFVRWSCEAKRRIKVKAQQELAEQACRQRKVRALASINVLCLCLRFLIIMVRNLRDTNVKRELLLTFQDASEVTKVVNSDVDEAKRLLKLAERRIQCFFLRHVRPYIILKKKVMCRRIVRWWRRKLRYWKWRDAATRFRNLVRERACRRIQRTYRHFRTKKTFRTLLEKYALKKVQFFLRSWLMARVVKKEKLRVEIYTLAVSLRVANECVLSDPIRDDASIEEIAYALGMGFYRLGDFWNAASLLERAWSLHPTILDEEGRLALAYAHHMTWYMSYDAFNLTQAYELYCIALNELSSQDALTGIDPFILQDLAIVMMQMENFRGSLRMFARLIERFPQYEGFSLWLLLASVQLQQQGEWGQSVEYLTYLQDMPPSLYLERDIICLCAIGLERDRSPNSRQASREAWKSAIRLWNLEQKEIRTFHTQHNNDPWASSSAMGARQYVQSTLRKWGMLREFAQRATSQGHYLLACRLMLHMLELRSDEDSNEHSDVERSENAGVWWSIADVFRHLGHLDLYLDASKRSHLCVESCEPSAEIERTRIVEWRSLAETQAQSFRFEMKTFSLVEKLRQLATAQF